jgi:hypothetical protein
MEFLKSVSADTGMLRASARLLSNFIGEHLIGTFEDIRRRGYIYEEIDSLKVELSRFEENPNGYRLSIRSELEGSGIKPIDIVFNRLEGFTDIDLRVNRRLPNYALITPVLGNNLLQRKRIYGLDMEFVVNELNRLSRIRH